MELILKQPVGKLPFIGILFERQYEAESTNKSPIESYFMDLYKVIIEPTGDKLNLTLNSSTQTHKYENLRYDPQKLLKFLAVTRNNQLFNFSHIISDLGEHKVVRSITNRRLWVLKVNKVEFLYEH